MLLLGLDTATRRVGVALANEHGLIGRVEPPRREDVHRHTLEQAGEARPSLVGDQQDAVAAASQLRGQRMCRNHVSAGPSGGQHKVHAIRFSPLHFTT
jgi:hypothetical protein